MNNLVHKEIVTCNHCSTEIPFGKTPLADGEGNLFCCAGCRSVFSIIRDKGLTKFYDLTTKLGGTLKPVSGVATNVSDLSALSSDMYAHGIVKITIQLAGIQCSSCVWLLEQLSAIDVRIKSARVRLAQSEIDLAYDAQTMSPAEIFKLLADLGYQPCLPDDSSFQERARARKELVRIGVAAVCAMNIMVPSVSLYQGAFSGIEDSYATLFRWACLIVSIPVATYCALPMYRRAGHALKTGTLHIDIPIALGLILSFLLSAVNTVLGNDEIYFDSLSTIVFLLLSTRHLQNRRFEKIRRSLAHTWQLLPSTVRLCTDEGKVQTINLREVTVGMQLEIVAGERIPCDGIITQGESSLDCSVITGESLPQTVSLDSPVLAGAMNLESPLRMRTVCDGKSSRLQKIFAQVRSTLQESPQAQDGLNKLSVTFTAAALLLAGGAFIYNLSVGLGAASTAAIAMLTVTCPCAMALALPLLMIKAVGEASDRGILLRHADIFDRIQNIKSIYFDKTGTLTEGVLHAEELSLRSPFFCGKNIKIIIAALTKIQPQHPVSLALALWAGPQESILSSQVKAVPGKGVTLTLPEGISVFLGSSQWCAEQCQELPAATAGENALGIKSLVYIFTNKEILAHFSLSDFCSAEAKQLISRLKDTYSLGILSGDAQSPVRSVARELNISLDHCFAEQSPEQKAQKLSGTSSMYVGDGANDALALSASMVGVALRGGIQSLLECASVFIREGGIDKISELLTLSSRYQQRYKLILILGLCYNSIGIFLAFFGLISPLVAAIAMPIFSLILVLLSSKSLLR